MLNRGITCWPERRSPVETRGHEAGYRCAIRSYSAGSIARRQKETCVRKGVSQDKLHELRWDPNDTRQ